MTDITASGGRIKTAVLDIFSEVKDILSRKQDTEPGRGLSDENFTSLEKTKLQSAVVSANVVSVVTVTESNYPVSPDPNTLYLVVSG
jgi:hypothetical protein